MEIRVPEELQPILRDYTKAVIRERPEDVLQFSRDYFVALWTEQRMGEYSRPSERGGASPARAQPLRRASHNVAAATKTCQPRPCLSACAASYTLEPSTSSAFAELEGPLKRGTEMIFKRCAAPPAAPTPRAAAHAPCPPAGLTPTAMGCSRLMS